MITHLTTPFAHVIEPVSFYYLQDEMTSEVWEETHKVLEILAPLPHPHGGGASFYVVFFAPFDRSHIRIMHADALYARYETEFYNEEIHLITAKK